MAALQPSPSLHSLTSKGPKMSRVVQYWPYLFVAVSVLGFIYIAFAAH